MQLLRRIRVLPCASAAALAALCALLFLAAPDAAAAQATGTVVGTVTSAETGHPVSGAQVTVVGTQRGAVADTRGRYVITGVPAGEIRVRFQLIGYQTVERSATVGAGETATVDVELATQVLALDEVVVTGVGQATARRQLSTAVSVVGEQAIAEAPVQSIDQLLQGRVVGSTVSAVSAQPGTGSLISFRGVSSVFGSQTPVIYVDGVRVDNSQATAGGTGGEQSSALAELLTSDIERIEVTRGGPASTLYGSDAATGVIQIFTKRGSPGPARITARIEQGWDTPEMKYMLDAGLIYPDRVEDGEVPADFLRREFFRTGRMQNYHVGVTGGSDLVTYNVSGRIQQSEGVQPKNGGELFVTRGGLEARVAERSRITFTGSYTRSNFDRLYNGTAIADPLTALEVGDAMFFSGESTLRGALDRFLMADIDESVDRFNFSTGFLYDGSDLFGFRATAGVDNRSSEQTQFHPIGFTPGEATGFLSRRRRNFSSVTMDAAASLSWPRRDDVSSTLTIGAQGFRDNTYILFGSGTTFALPGSKDFGEAATVSGAESRSQLFNGGIYIDENLALYDRLFLSAGLRIDGGTTFGDEVDYATYPKVGFAYDVAREPMIRDRLDPAILSQLRFRAAYGETGKFPPAFLRDRTFDATPFRGESAPRFDNPGNEDLSPEVTKTIEAGFELALLRDRIGIDFTWYDATTHDALFFVPEPPLSGQGTQIRNVGEINNTGIELDASVLLVNNPTVSWQVGATYQTVDNEVVSMGGAADFFVEPQKHVTEGRPVGAWFVTTPIDTNGDGLLDGTERQYTGSSPTPTRSGSFSTRVTILGDLTLSALADWAAGHQVFDFGSVWATFNAIYRRELVDDSYTYPTQHDLDGNEVRRYRQGDARSEFLYDGDWWKLREVSARYTLPSSITQYVRAGRGVVYFSARNLYISSANPLIDPELAGLVGGGLALGAESSITMSPPRSFRFGLEFSF